MLHDFILSREFNHNQNTLLTLKEITAGSTLMLHVHLQRKPRTKPTQTSETRQRCRLKKQRKHDMRWSRRPAPGGQASMALADDGALLRPSSHWVQ